MITSHLQTPSVRVLLVFSAQSITSVKERSCCSVFSSRYWCIWVIFGTSPRAVPADGWWTGMSPWKAGSGVFPGAPNPCVDVASGHLSTHRTELLLACSQCNQVNLNVFKLLMHWLIDFNNALTTTFNYCTSCYLRSHFGQRDVITCSEIIINGTTW